MTEGENMDASVGDQEKYVHCMHDLCDSMEMQVSVLRRCIMMHSGLPSSFVQNMDRIAGRLIDSLDTCKSSLPGGNGCLSPSKRRRGAGGDGGLWFPCMPRRDEMGSPFRQQQERSGAPPKSVLSNSQSERLLNHFPNNSVAGNKHLAIQLDKGGKPDKALDLEDVEVNDFVVERGKVKKEVSLESWDCGAGLVAHVEEDGGKTEGGRKLDTNGVDQRDERRPNKVSSPASSTVSPKSPGAIRPTTTMQTTPSRPPANPNKIMCDSSDEDEETRTAPRRISLSEHMDLDERDPDEDAPAGKCVDGVMNPNWPGRLGWDIGVILLVVVDAMVLPFQMAYKDGEEPDEFDESWMWITTCFFLTDMVLSFLTGYTAGEKDIGIAPGKLVTSKWRIAKNYLRSWFPIDFASTIPWSVLSDLVLGGGSGSTANMAKLTKIVKFIRFLRLMRMLRLAKLAMIWEKVEARMGSVILKQSVALCRVILVLVGICHWNACIWWMIGQPRSLLTELMTPEAQQEYEQLDHWTTIERGDGPSKWTWLDHRDRWDQYIFCFYWTLGVMRTMPSEVYPVNKPERLYVMVFMFFAFSAFAICVALITQTFFKFSERKRVFDDDMAQVRMYMRSIKAGGASERLQGLVKGFLTHRFELRKTHAKETGVLGTLPIALNNQLKYERIGHFLQKLPMMNALPPKAAFYISNEADIVDMFAGACLSRRNKIAEAAWILISGRLMMSRSELGGSATQDTSVDVVDAHCLIVEKAVSNRTVHAVTCSEVIRIDKSKFVGIIKKNPEFKKSLKLNLDDATEDYQVIATFQPVGTGSMMEATAATAAIVAS